MIGVIDHGPDDRDDESDDWCPNDKPASAKFDFLRVMKHEHPGAAWR